jgi:hypothetical protein
VFGIYVAVPLALAILLYALRRTAFANVTLLFLTLSVCLTGLETYYRFFYCESDGFGRLTKNFSDRYYRFDAYGLRASNLPLSTDRDNLIVVGDSHVFGAGLRSPAERFSARLANHYRDLHVVNLGFPGWDTKTELRQLIKYTDTGAAIRLVVLAYFFNDIAEDVTAADRQRVSGPIRPARPTIVDGAFQWVSKYSRFVELFYFRIGYPRLVRDRLGQIQLFYDDPAIRARHLASIEEFRATVEGRYHARLLVVTLPFLHSAELLNDAPFYQKFDADLSQRGFRCLDMQPVFARYGIEKLRINHFDPHTNAFANCLVADAIIHYLDEHPDLLERNDRTSAP